MNLLESLVDAIVRLEGDALIMHVGEKPYVVTTSAAMSVHRGPLAWGQVELSSRVLTSDAVLGMIAQILPSDLQQSLDALGAVEHELTLPDDDTRYTVVAARGGDDVWLELKRRQPVVLPPMPAATPTRTSKATKDEPAQQAPAPKAAKPDAPRKSSSRKTQATEPPAPVETSGTIVSPPPLPAVPSVIEIVEPPLAATPAPDVVTNAPTAEPDPAVTKAAAPADPPPIAVSSALGEAHAGEELTVVDVAEEITWPSSAAAPASLNQERVEEEPVEPFHLETAPTIEAAPIDDIAVTNVTPVTDVDEPSSMTFRVRQYSPDDPMPVSDPAMVTKTHHEGPSGTDPAGGNVPVVEETVAAAASALLTTKHTELPPTLDAAPPVESIEIGEIQVLEPVRHEDGKDSAVRLDRAEEIMPDSAAVMSSTEPAGEVDPPSVAAIDTISVAETLSTASETVRMSDRMTDQRVESPRATIVPMSRMRAEPALVATIPTVDSEPVVRILRLAANRGASVVYIVAQSRPMVRVDGEISPLEEEAVLTSADITLLINSIGALDDDTAVETVERLLDVPEVGRVRHLTFHDHRGPGIIFRMIPPRVISAEQLGLTAEIQGLCAQPDGLVIVTGERMSGKSTLLSAFVDLINHNRSDHVIVIESQIRFVHESRRSFVSQREIRGGSEALVQATRRALREDPDVLFIEDISAPDVAALALEAAAGGRLVFGALAASSTTAAIEQLIDSCPAERRVQMRTALADLLRGVVAQVLLRRLKGGRVAAREILLNSHGIASLILEGKTVQLPAALSGRRHGMMPLTDSLATLVRDGVVHLGEAYRKAADRDALLATLKREGIDTSFTERLA